MSLVSPSQSAAGETIEAADINNPVNQIAAVVNGNLDDTNISSVSGTKVSSGTLPGVAMNTVARQGWLTGILPAPNTVADNGNRSYDLTFNSTDLTSYLWPGMKLKALRTSAAPTKCTSLNGTTQYFVKSSPNKLTFTDDFVVSAWIKLTSYASQAYIVSRWNSTSGWGFRVETTGQLTLFGTNAGGANYSWIQSYQAVPLNKWVHVAAQLDMSAFTATTTTSYVMMDGVDVPAAVSRGGTNPTALVQAGNLEIGATNTGTLPFPGKIAQVAIYNAKVTQATIKASKNQALTGSETSLASAYSFNNSVTDLNTTTPNDLSVGGGSAVATNSDSPFSGGADIPATVTAGTLDYAIVTAITFSTNTTVTVFVPHGYALPTTGGITSLDYSEQRAPFGFPDQNGRWVVEALYKSDITTAGLSANVWSAVVGTGFTAPVGSWRVGFRGNAAQQTTGAASVRSGWLTLASTAPTNSVYNYRITCRIFAGAVATAATAPANGFDFVDLAAATSYILYGASDAITATETSLLRGTQGEGVIYAECAYV